MNTHPKSKGFDVLTEIYTVVDGHSIATDIFIPKSLPEGHHCPVIVRIHGGFLFIGNRGPGWFPSHLLQFALSKHAIIISPDYRLLPEATGQDILTDICVSLWNWILNTFPRIVTDAHPGITPDLTRILTIGESAGGYLATQLALAHPSHSPSTNVRGITAVCGSYPVYDLLSPFFLPGAFSSISESYSFFGNSPPFSVFTDHVAAIAAGQKPSIVTDGTIPEPGTFNEREQMMVAAVLHGKLPELLGLENDEFFPIERIERSGTVRDDGSVGKSVVLPRRIWVYHGSKDHVVPVEGSRRFVQVVQEKLSGSGTEVRYYEHEGGDHGFDVATNLASDEDRWVREGYAWLEVAWLGS